MKRISTIMIASLLVMGTTAVAQSDPVPGKNGNKYVPYEERTGNESIVYFTRNLTAEGLIEAYEQVSADIKGHTGVPGLAMPVVGPYRVSNYHDC